MATLSLLGRAVTWGNAVLVDRERAAVIPSAQLAMKAELESTAYDYVSPLAKGGMGEVHVVKHRALGHRRVMKLIRAADPEMLESLTQRLLREGRVVSGLQHPNIVHVSDFGFTQSGRPFLVTELLEGNTLKQEVLERGPLPIEEVVEVAKQVLAGLEYAHRAGVVHRDMKPDNVMMLSAKGDGSRPVKILDFGIVKIVDDDLKSQVGHVLPTAEGLLVGTPSYAAPEQVTAGTVDARTDIYAVGCVMYFLLTGKGPFDGRELADLLRAHLMETPPSPSKQRKDVPSALDRVVLRAMEKDPKARYQTATEMTDALGKWKEVERQVFAMTEPIEVPSLPSPTDKMAGPPTAAVSAIPKTPKMEPIAAQPSVAAPPTPKMTPSQLAPPTVAQPERKPAASTAVSEIPRPPIPSAPQDTMASGFALRPVPPEERMAPRATVKMDAAQAEAARRAGNAAAPWTPPPKDDTPAPGTVKITPAQALASGSATGQAPHLSGRGQTIVGQVPIIAPPPTALTPKHRRESRGRFMLVLVIVGVLLAVAIILVMRRAGVK